MKFGLFVFCMTLVPLLSWAEDEKIAVQSMCELDEMSQEKLVNLRERSMIYSAFYSYDYKPKIFERYNPKEKWVGDKYSCYRNEFYDGKSEASIWLKNPNVLIHPVAGTLRHDPTKSAPVPAGSLDRRSGGPVPAGTDPARFRAVRMW